MDQNAPLGNSEQSFVQGSVSGLKKLLHKAGIETSIVYVFFPETKWLALEYVDHLCARDGLTGGVFETCGHAVKPHFHCSVNTGRIEKPVIEQAEYTEHTAA
ncbi:hypothetical protein N7468_006221 [Penicillium chermesinum]|uniref:Uncharacterized protein n=1 Tax=Penicillium chermesinum TaxID=63820 RepID=A0A9W9NSJ2_9EURO|nr:uncharacterized protein N7468_006221 [Penicillium chermesinum]KAJ5224996.1 hypothetical protein N7468_006221 [Penicillium chermesinum]KAJ6151725.1 hypothetical protein N7470_006853 [Penicillium chermesinum]